jgi:predicted flap endonuclease-1-like 5' DNA nuclease
LIVEVGRLRAELTEARSAADEVAALGEVAAARESRVPDHPEPSVEEPAAGEQDFVPEGTAEVLTKDEGLARMAEIAARTAGEGPIADDDLKKVHGIGPKLESTLKALGITSFRQIANFQPEDIVAVTSALNAFKGRIERDDWMSSAAQQHLDKYGEPV